MQMTEIIGIPVIDQKFNNRYYKSFQIHVQSTTPVGYFKILMAVLVNQKHNTRRFLTIHLGS